MARLLADENFPLKVSEKLRTLGHDVTTLQETGHANQGFTDAEVLEFATHDGRTVLTLNRWHFIRLHNERTPASHAGIVACTVDSDFIRQANSIHELLLNTTELKGVLLRVNRPSTSVSS
jgi:predicted nuclease of predicted toxin-antitoxin system